MSGLLTKRAWLGGVALIAAMGAAACGDDDDSTTSGGGTHSGGNAGSGQAGDGDTAGSNSKAGKGGMAGSGGSTAGNGGSTTAGNGGTTAGSGGANVVGGAGGEGASAGSGDLGGAGGEGGAIDPFADIRTALKAQTPLPAVPADTTNQYADNAAAAAFGQRLFFDKKFSGALKADNDLGTTGQTGKVSCATCHSGPAMIDERNGHEAIATATGINTRNTPAVVNSAFYTWTNWGARFSAQWELPLAVVENGNLMNFNRLALTHRIFDVYKADYEAVFGALEPAIGTDAARFPAAGKAGDAGAFDGMAAGDKTIVNRVLVNYSKAIQAYMRKLVSREAPFDAFMAGDDNALTASEINGARQFIKHGCNECHSGPHFSDQAFHNLGVPQTGTNVPATDDGRYLNTPQLLAAGNLFNRNGDFSDDKNTGKLETIPSPVPEDWKGTFRTPTLRGVAQTAPYMHTGQLTSLDAVVDFYAAGAGGGTKLPTFTISAQEKADLVAFLGTLTGKAVPGALFTDTSAP